MVNRDRPHLLVLPEDDATRSLANGFSDRVTGQMEVLRSARGWPHVLSTFEEKYIRSLRTLPQRYLVLLIDFDDQFPSRLAKFKNQIPEDIAGRVYVVGALTEAETLTQTTGYKLGKLGEELARECEQEQHNLWLIEQIRHNQLELERLHRATKHFLFG